MYWLFLGGSPHLWVLTEVVVPTNFVCILHLSGWVSVLVEVTILEEYLNSIHPLTWMVQRLHKTTRLLVLSGLRRTEEKKREVLGLAECRASELLRPSLDFVYIEILIYCYIVDRRPLMLLRLIPLVLLLLSPRGCKFLLSLNLKLRRCNPLPSI